MPEAAMAQGPAEMSILIEVEIAVEFAGKTGLWIVLVCPNAAVASLVSKTVALAAPAGSSESGRTLMLPNGGRVSAVAAETAVFIPDGQAFMMEMVGWRNHLQGGSWKHWENRASGILTHDTF